MAKRKKIQQKVNVLFVMLQLDAGGSERVVLDLAQHIDKEMFNVYVACFSGGQLYQDFSDACTKLFYVKKRSGLDHRAMLKIGAIIQSYNINIINPHHYSPFVYSYLGSKIFHNRSLIFTEHSVPEVVGLSMKHKHICNILCYRTNAIIGISNEIAASFKKLFPAHSKKVVYIPNGVNIDLFSTPVDRNRVRAELGILSTDIVIGMIANFRRVKNHVCLIKSFYALSATHPNVRLVLVGRGFPNDAENSEYDIRKLISSFGIENRVILTGYRSDIPRLLKTFDIFCLPSFSEGLPVSILEAMASKIPVVGSNVRGIREVISPENTGLLFPVNDHVLLAGEIERLMNDAEFRLRLKEKAFDYVSRNHGMRQWIDKHQTLFLSAQ